MATHLFRVRTIADGNFGALAESDQTTASRTDGWTVAKTAAGLSAEFDAGTKQAATAFSSETTTPKPASFLTGTTANAFKTPTALTGTFAATNWFLTGIVRATTASSQAGRLRFRVFKSVNADGSGATELTSATVVGGTTSALTTTADGVSQGVWSPGSLTLNNEFLFFVLAWEITTAAGSTSADVVIRVGTSAAATVFVTPDLSAGGTAWTQPVNDTLSLADSAATESGRTADVPDTLALADAVAFQADYARTVPDTVALADAQTVARDIALAIPDTLTLADATVVARDIAQPVADTVALADSATTAAGKGATIPDTVSVADALAFDRALTLADTVALTDITAQAEEIHIADTLALTDFCDPVKTVGGVALTQPIDDTLALADALVFDRTQTVADTLTLADALASQADLQRTLVDTVAMADSLATQAALLRSAADTLALDDLATPVKTTGAVDWVLPLADTLALADQIALGPGLTFAETLALADAVSSQSSFLLSLADQLSFADSLLTSGAGAQQIADTVALTDAVAFQASFARTLADTLSLTDLATPVLTGAPAGDAVSSRVVQHSSAIYSYYT